jgi:hypothetical protein
MGVEEFNNEPRGLREQAMELSMSLIEPMRIILRRMSKAGVGRELGRRYLRPALRKTGYWREQHLDGYLTRACCLLVELGFIERQRGGRAFTLRDSGEVAGILPPDQWENDTIKELLAGRPPIPPPCELLPPGEEPPWWVVRRRPYRRRRSRASTMGTGVDRDQDRAAADGPASVAGIV